VIRLTSAAGLLMLAIGLAGCATRPPTDSTPGPVETPTPAAPRPPLKDGPPDPADIPDDVAETPDAVPVPEGLSKYGNPASYTVLGKTYYVLGDAEGFHEKGLASWYGRKFHGRRTSSGEIYDMFKMTAAHKTLPLPSYLRVTNTANNKSVIVRVNDRGPFHSDRIIDLSYAAAAKLEMLHGVGEVEVSVITPGQTPTPFPDHAAEPADGATWLQVAAFSNPVNAKAMRDTLAQIGITHIVVREDSLNGKPLNRVIIGPFTDEAMLNETRSRLSQNGLNSFPVMN